MGTHDTRSSVGGPTGDGELPASVLEELTADRRRRELLAVLDEREEPMPLLDLAREVVAREREVPNERVDDDSACEAREDIYQRHLPKLTATGVVRFDSLVSTVELAVDDERLRGAIRA